VLDEHRPIPADEFGAGVLELHYSLDLRFRNPQDGCLLPFQGETYYLGFAAADARYLGCSYLRAGFSNRHHVSVFFSLPFEEVDDRLRGFVFSIQRELPFALSGKHWKQWRLNGARTGYIGRKISNVVGD
jgi:hypothetical protein